MIPAGLAGLAMVWAEGTAASPVPDFQCKLGDATFELVFADHSYPLSGAIYYAGGDRIAFTGYPASEAEWWPRVPWEGGARYDGHGITVWLTGVGGVLELPDGRQFACTRTAAE